MRITRIGIHKILYAEEESETYYMNVQIKGTTKELKEIQAKITLLINSQ